MSRISVSITTVPSVIALLLLIRRTRPREARLLPHRKLLCRHLSASQRVGVVQQRAQRQLLISRKPDQKNGWLKRSLSRSARCASRMAAARELPGVLS